MPDGLASTDASVVKELFGVVCEPSTPASVVKSLLHLLSLYRGNVSASSLTWVRDKRK